MASRRRHWGQGPVRLGPDWLGRYQIRSKCFGSTR
jgi:hypothetical protein